jgi:Serine/threonine protein kinase
MGPLTVNGRSFEVVELLGKGKGGYSYLVEAAGLRYVVKQIHHEPCGYYQFGDKFESELRDHARLVEVGIRMPRLLDFDRDHERLLKEYVDGPTIYDLVLQGPLPDTYFQQVREMCRALCAHHLNIDYFPTNFVVRDGLLHYIDFECNGYMDEWSFESWGARYWSQTPELLEYAASH